MATATKGSTSISYQYNDSGIRTSKTVNGVEHVYTLNGSQIVSETWGNNTLIYLYDEAGSPIGMQYRNSTMGEGVFINFFFEKNLFGDIVAVYNASGVKVISYTYDAWGNHTPDVINSNGNNTYALYNPFRYRGYYYDNETEFYYLQSRYYDPVTGRFLNIDAYISTGKGLIGYNMITYCNNNPIRYVDRDGRDPDQPCEFDPQESFIDLDGIGKAAPQPSNSSEAIGGGACGGGGFIGASPCKNGEEERRSLHNKNEIKNLSTPGQKTEIHHVVEQCQGTKSGFSNAQIQASSNKVILDYSIHRKISGYYSSIPDFTGGLRVRDWLAGQSFEYQTTFGWDIVQKFINESVDD